MQCNQLFNKANSFENKYCFYFFKKACPLAKIK